VTQARGGCDTGPCASRGSQETTGERQERGRREAGEAGEAGDTRRQSADNTRGRRETGERQERGRRGRRGRRQQETGRRQHERQERGRRQTLKELAFKIATYREHVQRGGFASLLYISILPILNKEKRRRKKKRSHVQMCSPTCSTCRGRGGVELLIY
jgi:hypothetical protein